MSMVGAFICALHMYTMGDKGNAIQYDTKQDSISIYISTYTHICRHTCIQAH